MNCNDFEKVASELTVGRLMMASKKEDAVAHAESCSLCASILSKEKFLTPILQIVTKAETTSAPAHLKANLLKAFQEQSKTSTTVFAPVRKENSFNFFDWKWAAVATVILIAVLSFAALHLFRSQEQMQPVEAKTNTDKIENDNKPNEKLTSNEKDKKTASPRPSTERNKVNIAGRNKSFKAPQPERKSVEPSTENTNSVETTTDFIALTYMDEKSAVDNGIVVRVQVPRATIIAMGLPLNAAQTDGYVKADVVIGDDGVARAIRLVQDSSPTGETKTKTN